jgi:arsenate reductase (glutaredoxin)
MCIIYIYQNCSTCRDALKWLTANGIEHVSKPIRETPPSVAELSTALKVHSGNLRKLFNTSGMDYRALGLKDQLPEMSEKAALDLLSGHGNLVKRPFLIRGNLVLQGFKEEVWASALT